MKAKKHIIGNLISYERISEVQLQLILEIFLNIVGGEIQNILVWIKHIQDRGGIE